MRGTGIGLNLEETNALITDTVVMYPAQWNNCHHRVEESLVLPLVTEDILCKQGKAHLEHHSIHVPWIPLDTDCHWPHKESHSILIQTTVCLRVRWDSVRLNRNPTW